MNDYESLGTWVVGTSSVRVPTSHQNVELSVNETVYTVVYSILVYTVVVANVYTHYKIR